MPVDNPKAGETEEQYLEYCIPAEINAGKAQDVAAAIGYSNYRREKMRKIKDTSAKVMARVKFDSDFRGINLLAGLEDSCWPGWKALGTKELDGKTVPNCIPEEDHPDFN